MLKVITIFFIILSFNMLSQDKLVIDGKEYFMHKVNKKETFYGLSKKYNVTIDQIKTANGGLKKLKKGKLLKIPTGKKIESEVISAGEENVYIVKEGEVAYGIARKLGINFSELAKLNPNKKLSEIKAGDELNVPKSNIIELNEVKTNNKGRIIEHIVQEGEGVYRIARKYNSTEAEVIKLNENVIKAGIKPGDILKIRVSREVIIPKIKFEPAIMPDNANFTEVNRINPLKNSFEKMIMKDAYNMTLLLPFMIDKNNNIQKKAKPNTPKRMYQLTEMSTHFYQGVKLAIDTAKTAGISLNLNVYDTRKDTGYINKLFKTEEVINSDVIIGPFYEKTYNKAVSLAKQKQIQIVCPVDQNNKSLFNNKYVTKLKASLPTQGSYLAKYIADNYNTENIVVITGKSKKDKYLAELIKKTYDEAVKNKTNNFKVEASTFKFASYKDMSGLSSKLSGSKKNIIIFPTTDKGLATSFFTQLNVVMNKTGMHKHKMYVFALENFKRYDNINVDHKIKYNLHVTSSNFIDYNSSAVKNFIKKYRKQFKTDPNEFAFMGYDAALYHAVGLKNFGKTHASYYDFVKIPLLHTKFNLKRTDVNSGFENKKVYILSYENYQLNKVN